MLLVMGALLVLAAAALWSTGGVGVKVANAEPLVIAGLRSAFALAFMAVVLVVTLRRRGGEAREALVTLLKRPLVWSAAASYALMVVMFCLSARRTTAANAIFIQYTGPVYVALLSGKLLGEKPSAGDYVAVLASLVGMALTFGGELGGGRMEGNLLAVLSSFGFAGLPLFLRIEEQRRSEPLAPLVAMSLGNALAAAIALPSCILHPPADERTWGVLIALGTIQIGLPYVLYGMAVRRLRALESSLLAMIEPVLSPIWVLLATGEKPTAMAAVGGAVIVASVAFNAIHRSLRRSSSPA